MQFRLGRIKQTVNVTNGPNQIFLSEETVLQLNISRRARAGDTDTKRYITQPKPQSQQKKGRKYQTGRSKENPHSGRSLEKIFTF